MASCSPTQLPSAARRRGFFPSGARRRGFSLLEMLVVLTVIGILAAFAVPAFTSMTKGSRLTQAADLIRNQLVLAQQLAIKENRNVVVQFYRYDDRQVPGGDRQVRAFQVFSRKSVLGPALPGEPPETGDTYGLTALSTVFRIPDGVIISDSPEFSTLLSDQKNKNSRTWALLPVSISTGEATAYYFEFRPDGSTTLAKDNAEGWFITLYDQTSEFQGSGLPANFITLVIDPFNGIIQQYQP